MDLLLIEDWINENEFSLICEKAEQGNRECAVFINNFMNELNSLHFHLHNKSHDMKIKNQISKIVGILDRYEPKTKISRL